MAILTKDQDENLDPVVKAAMIPQPSDQEEEKSTGTGEESTAAPAEQETKETPEPSEEKKGNQEAEAEESNSEGESEEESPDKPTRKERREERKKFLDSVRREQEQKAERKDVYQSDPNFKPIDYENRDYDASELEEDRSKYGQNEYFKGAKTAAEAERFHAEQDKFWQSVGYESTMLERDPEFAFLNDSNPETFDPDKTAFVNESYLEFVGYDPRNNTVKRTDISFENYTRTLVNQVRAWAEDMSENVEENMAAQKGNSSIRPGGGSAKKSLGQLKPGDISAMSDSDYEANKDEINRQILAAL